MATARRGIGWSPGVDLPVRTQPAVSSNNTACLRAMRSAGEDMEAAATRFVALGLCDGALLLGAAWSEPALSADGFLSTATGPTPAPITLSRAPRATSCVRH